MRSLEVKCMRDRRCSNCHLHIRLTQSLQQVSTPGKVAPWGSVFPVERAFSPELFRPAWSFSTSREGWRRILWQGDLEGAL